MRSPDPRRRKLRAEGDHCQCADGRNPIDRIADEAPNPEARYTSHEAVQLAFVAAIQALPVRYCDCCRAHCGTPSAAATVLARQRLFSTALWFMHKSLTGTNNVFESASTCSKA
jgi:hypothetical protein